jgi:hypothetical protein
LVRVETRVSPAVSAAGSRKAMDSSLATVQRSRVLIKAKRSEFVTSPRDTWAVVRVWKMMPGLRT